MHCNQMIGKYSFVCFITLIIMLAENSLNAAGFQLSEQSVTGLGRAFAGSGIAADDASDLFYNPAGMSLQHARHMQVGVSAISINAKFHNSGNSTLPGTGTEGGTDNAIPNLFFTTPLNATVKFGFGLTTPFGLRTNYDHNWPGRYQALNSDLTTLDLNPAISYQLRDEWSIGAGLNIQYAEATLSRATPPAVTQQADDAIIKLSGDSWALGYHFGIIYQPSHRFRTGLSYRSKVAHTLEGKVKLTGSDVGLDGHYMATTDVNFPETVYLSTFHELNPRWTLLTSLRWTRWSRFDRLLIEIDHLPNEETLENWNDTTTFSIGAYCQPTERWTLRAGIAFDNTPIPSAARRTPRIPDSDRNWLSFGASYRHSAQLTFDFGYAHLFAENPTIHHTSTLSSALIPSTTLSGKYQASVDILGFQLQYKFEDI